MTRTMESEETKIAVLVEKVGTMNTTLTKLDGKFDSMADKFALKTDLAMVQKDVEDLKGWKNKMLGAIGISQAIWAASLAFLLRH